MKDQPERARVQEHLDAGRDPELEKLVVKRMDERGMSRREALASLLPDREEGGDAS